MATTDNIKFAVFLPFRITFICSLLLGFEVQPCHAQSDDVFLPEPKVKTLEPSVTTPTPLPVTERDLWGIRLWQVAGLAFVATIVLITFCCCLCDCRIPKTAYDKEDKLEEGSDCSDTEPAAALRRTPQAQQGGKKLTNGSAPLKSQLGSTEHELGRANNAFDNDEAIAAKHNETWKGNPRVTFSRQP
ncbi:hypothetical protein ACROYT_G038762 [Oculina patagonica]